MAAGKKEIRVIVAPLSHGHVLLPGSVVAEIVSHTEPEPLKNTPAWMLGELQWKGWQVPVISYAGMMNKRTRDPVTDQTRILIFKTLSEQAPVPFIGMLIQGMPRMANLDQDTLKEPKRQNCPNGVFRKVLLDDDEAVIPDLDGISQLIETAAYAI